MKKLSLKLLTVIILLSVITFSSCKKDDDDDNSGNEVEITNLKGSQTDYLYTLSWDKVSDAVTYFINVNDEFLKAATLNHIDLTIAHDDEIGDIEEGETKFEVQALDESGKIIASNSITEDISDEGVTPDEYELEAIFPADEGIMSISNMGPSLSFAAPRPEGFNSFDGHEASLSLYLGEDINNLQAKIVNESWTSRLGSSNSIDMTDFVEEGKTYYWKVEMNYSGGFGDGTADVSKIHSFTVEENLQNAPVASFTVYSTNVTVNDEISFTNTSENAYSYKWNFGDGSEESTSESPYYTYTSEGTYTVSLTAYSEDGTQENTFSTQITVEASASLRCRITGLTITKFDQRNNGNYWDPDENGNDVYPDLYFRLYSWGTSTEIYRLPSNKTQNNVASAPVDFNDLNIEVDLDAKFSLVLHDEDNVANNGMVGASLSIMLSDYAMLHPSTIEVNNTNYEALDYTLYVEWF